MIPTVGGHFIVLSIDVTTAVLKKKKKSMAAEHPIPIAWRWTKFINVSIRDLTYIWTRAQTRL